MADLDASALTHDSVQLSWRPPPNPNGVVTGYEVSYQLISRYIILTNIGFLSLKSFNLRISFFSGMCDNSPDRMMTVVSDRPSYTISQLHPHSKYRVGVAARTNSAGERTT